MLNRIFALIGFFAFFAWGLAAALLGKVDIKPDFMASVKFTAVCTPHIPWVSFYALFRAKGEIKAVNTRY